uniref:photosystem I subunit III n=1 Tax=Rhodella violacea TaxID=2801 RepID=UPI001FCCE5DA|nr:photosystem I subunit III [Rhodella violacea]UNJ18154.1 photosystem I subunit III [Rhodella violacea]
MKRILPFLLTILAVSFILPTEVSADVAGLVPCSESKSFNTRLTNTIKKIETRLKKYEAGTPPAIALEQQIEKTKVRFDKYKQSNLLCGTDGLPHLITDGRWSHAREFFVPAILFLYISGWIGWVGRGYLQAVSSANKEIIIDVPLAVKFISSGFLWPLAAWQEFNNGELLAKSDEITVSPR